MCESGFAVMTVEESPQEVGPQHCRGPREAIQPTPQPPEVNGLARLWDCDSSTYSKRVWGASSEPGAPGGAAETEQNGGKAPPSRNVPSDSGGKQRAQAQTRGLFVRCASRSRRHLADVQERPPCADYRRQAPLWATRGGDYVNTRIASSEQEGHSIRLPISPKCHSFETGSIPRTVI